MTLPVTRPLGIDWNGFRRWVTRTLPMAWVPAAVGLGLAVVAMGVLDGTALWATFGVLASGVVWAQIVALVAFAQSNQDALGRPADLTTAEQLRLLQKQGWKVSGDAGVAIGPGGVLVVADKWRSNPTASDLAWAAAHVQRDRRRVAGLVRPVVGDAPVQALVVSWGTGDAELPAEVDGVSVVRGEGLAAWLLELQDDLLAPALVDQAWIRFHAAAV